MTKSTWTPLENRKWNASKIELEFEKLISDNGFMIVGKDGIFQEFMIYHTGQVSAKELFDGFLRFYNIRKQYEELKAEYEQEHNL